MEEVVYPTGIHQVDQSLSITISTPTLAVKELCSLHDGLFPFTTFPASWLLPSASSLCFSSLFSNLISADSLRSCISYTMMFLSQNKTMNSGSFVVNMTTSEAKRLPDSFKAIQQAPVWKWCHPVTSSHSQAYGNYRPWGPPPHDTLKFLSFVAGEDRNCSMPQK